MLKLFAEPVIGPWLTIETDLSVKLVTSRTGLRAGVLRQGRPGIVWTGTFSDSLDRGRGRSSGEMVEDILEMLRYPQLGFAR